MRVYVFAIVLASCFARIAQAKSINYPEPEALAIASSRASSTRSLGSIAYTRAAPSWQAISDMIPLPAPR